MGVRQKYDNHRIEYFESHLGRDRMLLGTRWHGVVERLSIRRLVAERWILDSLCAICWHLRDGLLGDDRTDGDKSFESAFKTSKPGSVG
jgi:hypothetical protein